MRQEIFNSPVFARCLKQWQRDPASMAFVGVADVLRVHGEFVDAIRVCRDGLRHNPDLVSARLVLAQCLEAIDRKTEAHAVVLGVLSHAPHNREATRLEARLNPINESILSLAHEEVSPPQSISEARNFPVIVSEAEMPPYASAERQLSEDFSDEEPTPIAPIVPMQFDTVEEVVKYAHDATPHPDPRPSRGEGDASMNTWATLTMAKLYESQGHDLEAMSVYQEILDHDPNNAEAQTSLQVLVNKNA